MKDKAVTIYDIADKLGLTASTVSRALQNNTRISEATRQKVANMAIELGYTPNYLASSLRKGLAGTIGIVVPRINRNFFSQVISSIESELDAAGYRIIICQSDEKYSKEVDNINALVNLRVDAVAISISMETTEFQHIEKLTAKNIPLVMFDRVAEQLNVDKVTINDKRGGYDATKHLLHTGCKRIAHLGGSKNISIYKNRWDGYLEALKDFNIEPNDELMIPDSITQERGFEAVKDLIEKNVAFDGIVAAGDYAALGALLCLNEHKIKVPEQVKITGFANEAFTALTNPSLTTVEQFPQEMGKTVASLLLERIKHAPDKPYRPKHVIVTPELLERNSSKK